MTSARLLLIAAAAAFATCAPARAEGGHGGGGDAERPANHIVANFTMPSDLDESEGEPEEAEVASLRVVEVPAVALPVVVDDDLVGYLFLSTRIITVEGVDAWKIRDKAHIIRDAFIRAVHRRPIADSMNPTHIDEERALPILREALGEVIELDQVDHIEIVRVDAAHG